MQKKWSFMKGAKIMKIMKLKRYLPIVAGVLMIISCGYKEFNPAGTSWALREDA
jgi:hypothetical protein